MHCLQGTEIFTTPSAVAARRLRWQTGTAWRLPQPPTAGRQHQGQPLQPTGTPLQEPRQVQAADGMQPLPLAGLLTAPHPAETDGMKLPHPAG